MSGKKKFVCDCGSSRPHGAQDCHFYKMAKAISESMFEQREQDNKNSEEELWERLRL